MSFNVASFKKQVGDFLRPHSYIVKVSPPAPVGGLDSRELSIRTQSITAPGISFAEVDNHKIYGSGLQITVPHSTTVQEITCVHLVDSKGGVLQTFYDWTNNIVDISGQSKYSPYYYDQYTVDMQIEVYDLSGQKVKTYELKKAFPKSYDPVELSWESTDIMQLSVSYTFESFEIK